MSIPFSALFVSYKSSQDWEAICCIWLSISTDSFYILQYKLFSTWNLPKILLGSIAIPGIFPVVCYEEYTLMNGSATNNFPVDIAKKKYPK